jgi:uncharacterized protein (DUF488 family)
VEIYTTGFTKKTAESFFTELRDAGIRRVIDVRLNNVSQLAGFTKRNDLRFFLREIVGAEYVHELRLAPRNDDLLSYRNGSMPWDEYAAAYGVLLREREVEETIPRSLFESRSALLCSEEKADRCHRRLAAEYLAAAWGGMTIVHL